MYILGKLLMFFTSILNRWLNRSYKVLAILLVLFAVLISAFRLFLPYVEHYRQDVQYYINEKNKTNIIIGGLAMSWQRWGPTVIAKQVSLVNNDDAHIYIDEIEVQVDFWSSLIQQQLVSSNLILAGANIELFNQDRRQAELGRAKQGSDETQSTAFEQVSSIFLNRLNQFSVRDSHVVIHNETLDRNFHVSNLHWKNRGDRHQAQGNIIVNELSSNKMSLKIDVKGDAVNQLNGQMYLEANHLDVTPWLDSLLAIANDKTKADVGFSAWLTLHNGSVERLLVDLQDNFIGWQGKDGQQSLTLSSGQLLLIGGDEPDSLKIFSTPLRMQFNQLAEQEYTVQINKTSGSYSLYLSAFDLALISQVSPLFIADNDLSQFLIDLNITGQASDVYLRSSAEVVEAVASFSHASTKYSQGVPGVDNLSGELSLTKNNLHLELLAEQGALDFKQHFVAPIVYQTVSASANFSFGHLDFERKGWQLQVNDIDFTSAELSMAGDLAVNAFTDAEPTMSLLASVTRGDASKAGHYFPLTTMSANLVRYLNNGLISGSMAQAQVLINGPLSHFPFKDNSGIFIVDAELEQAQFQFESSWPAIQGFAANLNFTNNSMLITGRSGSLVGLDVSGVQAAIDDLAQESILTVDTIIKPSSANLVADLIAQSPLKDNVGEVLQQLQISGDIDGEFHLNLPLNAKEQVVASGLINFSDNRIALKKPRMDFEQVNGQLTFSNDNIAATHLSLTWLDLPLVLDVQGVNKADYYDTDISIIANWQEAQWQAHVSPLLKKYFGAQLQWQGDLSLHQHHNGEFSYNLAIDSDLAQSELNLPAPYYKATGKQAALSAKVTGQTVKSTINVSYGEQLSFFGVLDHQESSFGQAHLVLGDEQMLLPMDGFHITTKLTQANFTQWQPLISDIIDSVQQGNHDNTESLKSPRLFSRPERIRGTVAQLDILGQQLNNVSFNLLDQKNWWLLQLNAKEIRSRVKFYPDWLSQGIDVNADFIHLSAKKATEHDSYKHNLALEREDNQQAIFANMPTLTLHCERCQVGDLDLGTLSMALSRHGDDVIKIDHLTAKREQAEFTLFGQWQYNNQTSVTDIQGSLTLKDIEYELEQLGYGSIIKDSGGKLDYQLAWQGGPHQFSFALLNGDINAAIDDGYLAEVRGEVKIASILSLDSIVRKLTLDFRDIFSDGMFYSDITGDYQIKNGVLYTSNTRMNGTAGNLYINGNTDFITDMLDYKMSYKPNLTSSLPVIAWITMSNPVGFLAGIALDQVITSQVVSEVNFELTGSVKEPDFKEVNRKSRDVSVGLSTPPKFVDTTTEKKTVKDSGSQPESLQQNKAIDNPNNVIHEL